MRGRLRIVVTIVNVSELPNRSVRERSIEVNEAHLLGLMLLVEIFNPQLSRSYQVLQMRGFCLADGDD